VQEWDKTLDHIRDTVIFSKPLVAEPAKGVQPIPSHQPMSLHEDEAERRIAEPAKGVCIHGIFRNRYCNKCEALGPNSQQPEIFTGTEMLLMIRATLQARADGLAHGGDTEVMEAVDRIVARESVPQPEMPKPLVSDERLEELRQYYKRTESAGENVCEELQAWREYAKKAGVR
jgi:hypothetical protein